MNNKLTFSDACNIAGDNDGVIIPKELYEMMKKALEQFANRNNWSIAVSPISELFDRAYWVGENENPWEIAQKALEAMK